MNSLSKLHPLSTALSCWFLLLGFFSSGVVCAHHLGLSVADIQINPEQIDVRLTFSRSEIEALVAADVAANTAEPETLRTRLNTFAANALTLRLDGTFVAAESVALPASTGDVLKMHLRFPNDSAAQIHIHIPILAKLKPGHRLYLTLYDEEGNTHGGVLSAENDTLSITLRQADPWSQFTNYLREGIWHIGIGFDHLLFLLALLLPAPFIVSHSRWQARSDFQSGLFEVLKIVTAFTVAHSITLGLAVFGWIALPSQWVESAIAASIILVALSNIYPQARTESWIMAFLFGLIHGMGFANVLIEMGLPNQARILALLGFNLGVECGQLILVAALLPFMFLLRNTRFYRSILLFAGSWCIVAIAALWLLERITDVELVAWI